MRWWERVSAWDEEHRLAVDALTATGLLLVVVPGLCCSLPEPMRPGFPDLWHDVATGAVTYAS